MRKSINESGDEEPEAGKVNGPGPRLKALFAAIVEAYFPGRDNREGGRRELARRLGVSESHLRKLERGAKLSFWLADKLIRDFRVNYAYIAGRSNTMFSDQPRYSDETEQLAVVIEQQPREVRALFLALSKNFAAGDLSKSIAMIKRAGLSLDAPGEGAARPG